MDADVEAEVTRRIKKAKEENRTDLSLMWIDGLKEIPTSVFDWEEITALDLDGTEIKDLRPIAALKRLTYLDLSNTPVTDLAPLQNMSGLRELDLTNSKVSDLTSLRGLNGLLRLDLDNTEVTDLKPLEDLPNLKILSVVGLKDVDLENLRGNRRLQIFGDTPSPIGSAERLQDELSALRRGQSKFREDVDSQRNQVAKNVTELDKLTTAIENSLRELAEYKETSDSRINQIEKDYRNSMEAAALAFSEDQAIAAPVALWTSKQTEHEETRNVAFWLFVGALIIIALVAAGLVYALAAFPKETNALFAPVGCDLAAPTAEACKGLSLRGMLATAATLTVFTILLWFARLQMKLYLAERHLVLDARERRAFAETYVGLLKEGDTSKEASEQRALVYTALFRPSSDGTIKDEGGLDPAVTAALSKLLSRS